MEKIKCISREWLNPKTTFSSGGVSYPNEYYRVGVDGVKEISQNDLGCFNVYFETGEIISVTDVQYVEYLVPFETKEVTGDKPEFPKYRIGSHV